MRIKKIFGSVLLAIVTTTSINNIALATYSVDCDGYNSETSSYVYGDCDDGDFSGYDSVTGNYVYGDCEFDGKLDAYDSETGVYVYGDCEGE